METIKFLKLLRLIKKLNKETMKEMGIKRKDLKKDSSLYFEIDKRVLEKLGTI